ncbi:MULTISPECIES: hypothetical protein [Flavobacteriaceae]|uniref:hypothetical protein n=1 Tax=Flavobacteriaceae TaxID=49546 RepID=UPI003A8D80F6
MVDVTFLDNYTLRLKNAINTINYAELIVDDSQMVKFLNEVSKFDNHLLFGVIPDIPSSGTNIDNFQFRPQTMFLVLQKTDYASITHAEFKTLMQDTLMSAKAVIDKMLEDKEDYSAEGCMYMKQLNISSINLQPIWGKAGCNGWSIEFNFDSSY